MSEPKSVLRKPALRDRMRAQGGDALILPPEPSEIKSSIAATGNGYIMSIPEPGGFNNSVAYVIYAVVFGLIVGWYFVWPILSVPSPDFMRIMIGGFFTLLMIGPLLGALKHFLLRKTRVTIVTVSPSYFRVEERDGYKSIVKEIAADDLQDLILPVEKAIPEHYPAPAKRILELIKLVSSPGISAVSDRSVVTFGRGLPGPELAYIHGLIIKAISSH